MKGGKPQKDLWFKMTLNTGNLFFPIFKRGNTFITPKSVRHTNVISRHMHNLSESKPGDLDIPYF